MSVHPPLPPRLADADADPFWRHPDDPAFDRFGFMALGEQSFVVEAIMRGVYGPDLKRLLCMAAAALWRDAEKEKGKAATKNAAAWDTHRRAIR